MYIYIYIYVYVYTHTYIYYFRSTSSIADAADPYPSGCERGDGGYVRTVKGKETQITTAGFRRVLAGDRSPRHARSASRGSGLWRRGSSGFALAVRISPAFRELPPTKTTISKQITTNINTNTQGAPRVFLLGIVDSRRAIDGVYQICGHFSDTTENTTHTHTHATRKHNNNT